ncbi:MAG: hypothetical protein M3155_08505 [Actinomycetota bacterium]|nr:hypothetical protein [Actinomycetota bacterium]
MATGLMLEFSGEGLDEQRYRAVNDRVNPPDDRPAGCIFHSAGPGPDGGWRVVDVWESRQDFERFQQERLFPALSEVFGDQMPAPPTIAEWEVVNYNFNG